MGHENVNIEIYVYLSHHLDMLDRDTFQFLCRVNGFEQQWKPVQIVFM